MSFGVEKYVESLLDARAMLTCTATAMLRTRVGRKVVRRCDPRSSRARRRRGRLAAELARAPVAPHASRLAKSLLVAAFASFFNPQYGCTQIEWLGAIIQRLGPSSTRFRRG